jgi:ATP-binding protein involved in chromosome partitioning
MGIAVPVMGGVLLAHFGHCEQFAIIDVDHDSKEIRSNGLVTPPPHEPGVLLKWLAGLNVRLIIAGGMGQRAQRLFEQNNVEVAVGAPQSEPEELVLQYLAGRLQCGRNVCDH